MLEDMNAKEEYLAREVTEKGIKTQDFLEFLKGKKEEGNNLGKWQLDELKEQVASYHQINEAKTVQDDNAPIVIDESIKLPNERQEVFEIINDKEQRAEQKSSKIENMEKDIVVIQENEENLKTEGNKEEEVNFTSNEKLETRLETRFGDMGDEIKCIKLDTPTAIANSSDISIKLLFPEKKYAKKTIISFAVETSPLNYKVRRTVADFIWLRTMMKRFYPGVFIPPLSKDSIIETTSDAKIEKKMIHYQKFLNIIAQNEFLKTSKLLFDFLTTSTEAEFLLKAQAYEKIEYPKIVSQLQSKTGTITVHPEILDDNEHTEKTNKVVQNNITVLTKLNQSFKRLLAGMKQVSNSLYEISEVFNELIKTTKDYDAGDPYIKQFEGLKEAFAELYYNNQKQTFIYDIQLKQHFKYIQKEYVSIKELRDSYFEGKNNYYKTKEKLRKKKEELFNKKDLKTWELNLDSVTIDKTNKTLAFEKMLPRETQALFEEKQFCCYLGCSFETEFANERELIGEKSKVALKEMISNTLNIHKVIESIWNQLQEDILVQS